MFFKKRKPEESKDEEQEHIFILSRRSDEYYETLAFRFASYLECLLEIRKYSTSAYKGHAFAILSGADDRQWINVVTCPRTKQGYNVVISGNSCGSAGNPFKALLDKACDILGSNVISGNQISALTGCASIPELELRLTALGF